MLGIELSEEEQLLKESVERFIERDYAFARRRELAASEEGFDRGNWSRFAELGWLGAALPEAVGGLGGGARHTAIIMEAFGRGLVTEPYLPSIVMSGETLCRAGGGRSQVLLRELVAGKTLVSLAYAEPRARYDLNVQHTRAERSADGFRLNGYKCIVLNGDTAEHFVVAARSAGAEDDREGISLFVVPRDASGLDVRPYPTNDGGRAAELTLDDVELAPDALLGEEGGGYAILERAVDKATAAVSAESLGIMSVLNDMTVEYAKTREQFGQPIGKNQALQHRLVDMFVALEESRSLLAVYSGDADSDDTIERARAVSAMKIQIGKAGRTIGQEAIQLHGGIGMTQEYPAGHYFKRLTVITRLFGDLDWHLDRFAALA